jgi:hypothetical protein
VLSADQIGLLPSDNVDAMKCYHTDNPPPPPEEPWSETGYNPQTVVDPESTNLGEPATVDIMVEVPPGSLGTERVSLQLPLTPGSWPAASLPYGTQVGWTTANADVCGQQVTVAGVSGAGSPIPLRTVDPGTVNPEVLARAGVTLPEIIVAFQVDGSEVAVYDSTGTQIDLPFEIGVGNGFVVPSPTGGTELVLTSAGSIPLPPCIGPRTIHLVLFGTGSGPVRLNPADCGDYDRPGGGGPDGIDDCAGYYPVAGRGISEVDPFAGGRYADVGLSCFYFGGTAPAGSDDDGDCLEDVATAQPARPPSESSENDLVADRDGDGLLDGLEVLFGSHPDEADSDGDGLSDYDEFLLRTTPNPEWDSDEDGKGDAEDNCPTEYNPLQEDLDADGQGDVCDLDDDGDYLEDVDELTDGVVRDTGSGEQTFRCKPGEGLLHLNPRVGDSDGDTVLDGAECLLGSDPTNEVAVCNQPGQNGVSVPEICGDNIDNDCDGLTDEMATDLGLKFVGGACSDVEDGDPDHDGLMDGEISWESMAQTMCVPLPGAPEEPADPLVCNEKDPQGNPLFQNNADDDGLTGRYDDDSDNDGVPDGVEFMQLGTSAVNPDSDNDGCAEGKERGSNPTLGGQRNPLDKWDFYDVPAPTIGNGGSMANKDKAISIGNDVLGVLEYAGTSLGGPPNAGPDGIPGNADDRDYDDDVDDDDVSDGMAYDRSVGVQWSGPPNGAISVGEDVLLVLDQSGHSCQALP